MSMPAAVQPYQATRQLPVSADVAWRILTSQVGARLWLAESSHPGIRMGATFPLRDSGPAEITDVQPGRTFQLSFSSGRRAVIEFRAPQTQQGRPAKSEISVCDYGGDSRDVAALHDSWSAVLVAADFVVDQTLQNRRSRQAIIVIHGVGSQRPLSTVKSLISALIGDAQRWSKPDQVSASYELRRYQLPRTRYRPRTDLFELYWADKVPGTKIGQVLSWLRSIIFRRPRNVDKALRPIAYLVRITIVAAVVGVAAIVLTIGINGIDHLWHAATGLARLAWVSTLLSLLGAAVSGFLIATLGDAARYLDAAPDNIAVRQSIRQNGVALLRRLHQEGGYDRIAIVGHSLGSVIGYDVIRLYWSEVHSVHGKVTTVDQTQLNHYQRLLETAAVNVDDYRRAQRELWREYRRHGHPWLVTDLVTVGSPLTHAGTLLARSPADLEMLIKDLELPTCPPLGEPAALVQRENYLANGHIRTIQMLTHAAPFAVTRWTNIYIPAKGVVFGDPIGGPLAQVFGRGIKDVPVEISHWWRRRTPLAHTAYWRHTSGGETSAAIRALREYVDLESGRWMDQHIDEMPWEMSIMEASRQP
jgi:hypothetical protein